jgi:ribosomal protein L9
MPAALALLKFVARAALNAVGAGMAGDFAMDVLPDMMKDVWRLWAKDRNEAQRKADVVALVQTPASEVQRQVKEVVQEVVREAGGPVPIDQQLRLETYLNEIPSVARQSLMRRDDPRGLTVPSHMTFQKPEDLGVLLPPRLPRFKPGDRPFPYVDWELVKLLGVGGFGEVWKARNPHAPHLQAALKFCLDPTAREQLLKYEATVLARVMGQGNLEGIVQLKHTYLSADPPCLEYEFIDGNDLAGAVHAHQAAKGPLPPDTATKIVRDLARAVGRVHKLSPPIVHRDLKPANVLVRRKEGGNEFLITDFGIGGVVTSQALEQTRQGTTSQPMLTSLKGAHTPLYASPEQKRCEPPDPRDDVHALGVIWYQLLIGDFSEGAPSGRGWKRNLRDRGVSDKLLDLIEACFDARAEDRPANGADLAVQIDAIRAEEKAVQDRIEKEKAERERGERERAEQERAEQERIERETAEREKAERVRADQERRAALNNLAEQIQKMAGITIKAEADDEGRLYGPIAAPEVSRGLKAKHLLIEPEMVRLEGPIKETGLYTVKLNLGYDTEAEVKVAVIKAQDKKVGPPELSGYALGGAKGGANRGKEGEGDWKLFSTADDGCREVARASGGKLSSKQVRILRGLRDGRLKTMAELKETQGVRPDKSLGGAWMNFLYDLERRKLVQFGSEESARDRTYWITPAGKALLEKAEAAAERAKG